MNTLGSTILFICITILFSCCNQSSSQLTQQIKQLQKTTIYLPTNTEIIPKSCKDTIVHNSTKYKIVTYIDLDCEICWTELILWQEYWENNQFSNADFLCYVSAHSYNSISQKMEFRQSTTFPLFFDTDKQFLRNNPLLINKQFHTLLLDQNNNVILVGNPSMKKKIDKLYHKLLFKEI